MNKLKKQRGVALLFALGILSLILVTGLAFLGNALISQKIAFNSQESNAARLLARNAADRAIAHLAMFHITQAKNHAQYYVSDASSVFSRISKNPVETAETSVKTTTSEERAISQDQLSDAKTSRLNAGVFELGNPVQRFPWYKGNSSRAKWIYIHSDGKESAGNGKDVAGNNMETPIIGRYAYQVLPATSTSRISLYAVTKGSYRNLHPAVDTPATSNHKVAKQYRWGIDVDELLIDDPLFKDWGPAEDSTPLSVDNDDLSQREFDTFFNIHSGKEGSLYLADEAADNKKKDVELKKRWVKNIFSEGTGRLTRETYPDNSSIPYDGLRVWYPRFNLSDFKPYQSANKKEGTWYSRFVIDPKKEAEQVAALLNGKKLSDDNDKTVLDYLAGDSPVIYRDSNVKDRDYDKPIGLPFLRRIGSDTEKGAFEKVEYLRKQIAANLNDYCDDDSIPTSDKPADTWITDDVLTSNPPKYTGNEATPYINEIGFGFLIKNPKFNQGEKYTFSAEAQSEAWVELIKVYRNMIPDKIDKYGFAGKITDLELVLKVTIDGKATFFEKVNEGGQEVEKAFLENKEFDDVSVESTGGVFASNAAPFELSIKKGDFSGNGPYWLKNIPLPTTVSLNADFTDGIKEKAGYGSVLDGKVISKIEVELSKIKIEISKVKFNLGNLVLYDDSGSSKIGVDFVTVEKAGSPREVAPGITLCDGGKDEFNEAFAPNNAIIAFAGGMEAIDPRQNLNARSVQDKMNDWRNVDKPSFAYVPVKGKAQHHFPVDTWKWDDPSTRVTGGSVNDSSKPNAPMYADGKFIEASDKDKETAEDPAWQGDAANQHISTAVIRNAPMRSPWELGFIHRGIPFQTINLKKAGGIDGGTALDDVAHDAANFANWTEGRGTRYEHGDAGILDQIKMTEFNKSYGKIDMRSLLVTTNPDGWISAGSGETVEPIDTLNRNIFKSLFENMRIQAPWRFLIESAEFETAPAPPAQGAANPEWYGAKIGTNPVAETFPMNNIPAEKLRSKIFNNGNMTTLFVSGDNDAAQEERIGKVVNLIEAESNSLPNVFRIVVVVQNIRDFTGSVVRLDSNRVPQTFTAMTGRFDANIGSSVDNSIYYDEILGESRMLVTVEKIHYMEGNTPRARLRVKQIEYLD